MEVMECGCGCENIINKFDVRGRERKYIKGHGRRTFSTFWDGIQEGSDDECWEWQGKLSNGYGHFDGYSVHRHVYELTYGEISPDLCVLHKCDNRKCCNPNHLFLGT